MLIAGQRSGNTIIPLNSMTKRTKQITLTASDISASTNMSNISNVAGTLICYCDSSGNWRANFNLKFNCDIAATGTILNSYVVLATPYLKYKTSNQYQALDAFLDHQTYAGTNHGSYTNPGLTNLSVAWYAAYAATSSVPVYISGDVALQEEPTTYTIPANMEARVSAEVYVEPASDTKVGIVNLLAQSFSGIKTFVNGLISKGDLKVQTSLGVDKFTVASATGDIVTEGKAQIKGVAYSYDIPCIFPAGSNMTTVDVTTILGTAGGAWRVTMMPGQSQVWAFHGVIHKVGTGWYIYPSPLTGLSMLSFAITTAGILSCPQISGGSSYAFTMWAVKIY